MEEVKTCCESFARWLCDDNLPLVFTKSEGDTFGNLFALKYEVECPKIRGLYFCPWCGKELDQAFTLDLRYRLSDLGVERAFFDDFNFDTEIPEHLKYLRSRIWWDEDIYIYQKQHRQLRTRKGHPCDLLEHDIDEDTPVIYLENIRTYGLLKSKVFDVETYDINTKNEYCDFEPINYCYFCGAKFPDRLDEKLSEILRSEYGLESWKDFKRAPHEFHTDEWWNYWRKT
jgi:hypothetical protein